MWTKGATSSSWLFPSSMNSGDWTQVPNVCSKHFYLLSNPNAPQNSPK